MGLLILQCLIFLNSCSDERIEPAANSVQIMTYVSWFDEETAVTRAWEQPTGYTPYDPGNKSIGFWFTQDAPETVLKGYFFKNEGKWHTDAVVEDPGLYYLYGYTPHLASIKGSITPGAESKYANGANLTLEDVPTVMPGDLCVVIGAKEGVDAEHDNGLRRGDFAYNAKIITGAGGGDGNYVFLLLDHLYAALRIRLRVDQDYDALRTIKLKKLELKTQVGEVTSKQRTTIDVTLAANDGSSSPITSIDYTPTGEDIEGGVEFWSSSGETITTSFSAYIGHFMPSGINKLVLTSTYDVYDKQGNLVRNDCHAKNTMELSDLFSEQSTTRRGCRYTVNMTIKPTYLYMLSEPDLNNPTMTIN